MISVIITTFKRNPEIVQRAINSVLKQTYTQWELIVVDDSPANYSLRKEIKNMVQELSSAFPVYYIANKENMGACRSRNIGLAVAKGEYVAFLDDDDEWLPSKLERQLQCFNNALAKTAIVYCGRIVIDEQQKNTFVCEAKEIVANNCLDELLANNFIGGTSIPLLKTAYVREVGGFDPKMQSLQDLDLWIRLACKYPIKAIKEPLVKYYLYLGEQVSNNPSKKLAGLKRMYTKNEIFIKANSFINWYYSYRIAFFEACNKSVFKALYMFLKSVLLEPFWFKKNLKNLIRIFKGYLASFLSTEKRYPYQH